MRLLFGPGDFFFYCVLEYFYYSLGLFVFVFHVLFVSSSLFFCTYINKFAIKKKDFTYPLFLFLLESEVFFSSMYYFSHFDKYII